MRQFSHLSHSPKQSIKLSVFAVLLKCTVSKLDYVAQAYVIPRVPTKCNKDAINVENIHVHVATVYGVNSLAHKLSLNSGNSAMRRENPPNTKGWHKLHKFVLKTSLTGKQMLYRCCSCSCHQPIFLTYDMSHSTTDMMQYILSSSTIDSCIAPIITMVFVYTHTRDKSGRFKALSSSGKHQSDNKHVSMTA